jgi:alkanesulfonate monooxygenase SsuD/methylene tetrahydromethanopterin reductase-like flavin-dependent oxidoreductase (luciferase family)
VPPFVVVQGQADVTWPTWTALAAACEHHGVPGLYASDHYGFGTATDGALDAWTTLAALAARTTRLRLGTLVSPVTFRAPALLAKIAMSVDQVSGGRLDIGVGMGWNDAEHRAGGFRFPSARVRLELLEDQLRVLRLAMADGPGELRGHHVELTRAARSPRPARQPGPRILVGGSARPGSVAAAARWADEYNTTYVSVEEARRRVRRLSKACAEAGRDPLPLSVLSLAVVGRTDAEVRERAERIRRRMAPDVGLDAFLAERDPVWLIGTPEQVRARVRAYERAGVARVLVGIPDPTDLEVIALLAEL